MSASPMLLLVVLAAPFILAAEAADLWPGAKALEGFSLKNNSGVWYGEGDQVAKSARNLEPNTLPNCEEHKGEFDYQHYALTDPHYNTIFVDPKGEASLITAGHKRTTLYKITKVEGNIQTRLNVATGAVTCQFWRPYVDLRTGEAKAQLISLSEWTKHSNGTVTRASLNCAVKGTETPGCYPQSATKVQAVNIATYVCQNGECASFAPIYDLPEDH